MQALPISLSQPELQRLALMGRNPDGDFLKQILTRALREADNKNRSAAGVMLHQSQGHAQILQGLIERLEGKIQQVAPQRKIEEQALFGD